MKQGYNVLKGSNIMKNHKFKLKNRMLMCMVALMSTMTAHAASSGDLKVYAPATAKSSPTIMFMVETSSQMDKTESMFGLINQTANSKELVNDTEATGIYYYRHYRTVSGKEYDSRMARLRKTIFYLMNTPGAIPEDYKIGVGKYSASSAGNGTEILNDKGEQDFTKLGQDGFTSTIYIPAKKVGPVGSEHRNLIKKFIASICNGQNEQKGLLQGFKLAGCSGMSPMPWAYAEAGAYMFGTKTAPLMAYDETKQKQSSIKGIDENGNEVDISITSDDKEIRVFREKKSGFTKSDSSSAWQFCPEDKRKWATYSPDKFRYTCKDSDWVAVYKNNASQYGLKWNCGLSCNYLTNQPHGIGGEHNEDGKKWQYWEDTGERKPNESTWKYWKEQVKEKKEAVLGQLAQQVKGSYDLESRKLRVKSGIWQYCANDKQVLVNYTASRYRFNCKESDWVPIDKNNATSLGLRWNEARSRPHGIVGQHTEGSLKWQYHADTDQGPSNGWQYWIEMVAERKPRGAKIPTSIVTGGKYLGSGIRNTPIGVRGERDFLYKKPEIDECSGTSVTDPTTGEDKDVGSQNAIIFFTSGWPTIASTTSSPKTVMEMSLSSKEASEPTATLDCNSGLSSTWQAGQNPRANNWHCMGGYAKRLNSKNNPAEVKIKTGVFLFSQPSEFLTVGGKNDRGIPEYNCDQAGSTPTSIKNACKLASKDYGDGGYIQTSKPTEDDANQDLVKLLQSYKTADDSEIGVVPSDMPTVPENPYYPNALLSEGYLPLIKPDVTSKTALWQGNVRKYSVTSGAFKDLDNNSPFTTDIASLLADTTKDLWTALTLTDQPYKSNTMAGGAYEKLPYPAKNVTPSTRNVYLTDSSQTTGLRKLLPTAAGMTAVTVSSISGTQDDLRRRLLNFLGYGVSKFVSGSTDTNNPNTTDDQIKAAADSGNNTRSLGGVIHSKPFVVSYKGDIDTNGNATSTEAKVIFGAMDGALHVVDQATGQENLAFLPSEVLKGDQYKALTKDGLMDAAPSFGVGAPWASDVSYNYDFTKNKVTASNVSVYGGLRLGGTSYYGLDITSLTAPSLKFRIGPDQTNFSRMGYTFAKPVITHIKWGNARKKVMIVPAGYDRSYDKTDAARVSEKSNETKGNAVYIVDAATGAKLITAGKSVTQGATVTHAEMRHSIVGSVKVLDRDADDLADHVYFADLAGQVFRLDINNTNKNQANATAVRVARIANLTAAHGASNPGPRFYETPIVTIHNEGSQRFAVVSVASGDRSNPDFKNSDDATGFTGFTNRVYAIFDKDVTREDLFASNITLNTDSITLSKLKKDTTNADVGNLLSSSSSDTKRLDGWYLPLDRFASDDDVDHLKAFGPMAAINNDLYVGVYNYYDGGETNTCASGLRGKTEANQFCLPYGFCVNQSNPSKTMTSRQRFIVGRGIAPITFGSKDAQGLNRSVITQSTTAPTALENDGPAIASAYNFNYILKPARWFELANQED